MAAVPDRARVVVIGAGIVGNSLVHHLARLGWTDIVQIDKGPLPNPGGSTGHASNFVFPVDHSREITDLTLDSVRQYEDLGVFTRSGGYEVARTEERMQELRRRMASARAWGIEAELVDPAHVAEHVPYVDPAVLLGAFWSPSVGVVDSVGAGTLMRQTALDAGALSVLSNAEVTEIEVEGGRIRAVSTTRGRIATDTVVVACGVWSPRIAAMAGETIELTPAVHQMISVGPVAALAARPGEISFPIIRDMDTFCYERQHGSDLEIGSYAHRPILHEPDDIPSIEAAKLSPTEMPFTADDFDPQLEQALELMPEVLGDPSVEIRYAINGLLSLTPDGSPVLGESARVPGLWSAAAVWVKEGPGVGRAIAELMTRGVSEIDVSASAYSRFHPHQRSPEHVRARASEGFNKTYGIVHPGEQWTSRRGLRRSGMHARQVELGAEFFETAGWERPQWYGANSSLLGDYGERVMDRPHEWDARWWSPIINAEHLAMRERAGLFDLSSFVVFDVAGPEAAAALQGIVVAQVDVEPGRVIYTPVLDPAGGILSDLTIMRLSDTVFRVVTGAAHGMVDLAWFTSRVAAARSSGLVSSEVCVVDRTSAVSTLGLWGPEARDVAASLTDDDLSDSGFGFARCREVTLAGLPVLASRISYVGDLGWEFHVAAESAGVLWDHVFEAGRPHGLVPVGMGVYGTTGRLEKGYRAFGAELDGERTLVEAGMVRPRLKDADFVGREVYAEQRTNDPASVLCTLRVEDPHDASGTKRYMLGGEPVVTRAGEPLVDGAGKRSYVTSAGSAPSLEAHLLMSYLPPEHAHVGAELAVVYFEETYPVTVVAADATPVFDPDNARIRR